MQTSIVPPNIMQDAAGQIILSGNWAICISGEIQKSIEKKLEVLSNSGVTTAKEVVVDGAQLDNIDSAGVWILQRHLQKMRAMGKTIRLQAWLAHQQKLMEIIEQNIAVPLLTAKVPSFLEKTGRKAEATWKNAFALFSFIGESAVVFLHIAPSPLRWRWRMVLSHIQIAGVYALPIIGLTSFLLGIVISYQGSDQLRHYGANIFVVELVGYSMLREFSPLITAIIIAGRSGSAFAAQIGTMVVTEEIDAMHTLGIAPIEFLVLPKAIALMVALPLLTVFSDISGVLGGMFMARSQLNINFNEFLLRFGSEVHLPTFLVGIGKSLVFAWVIAFIGCFQGFQTKANADSVGRQTTKSVVQSIFIVIVLDAVFSVILSILDL